MYILLALSAIVLKNINLLAMALPYDLKV